MNRALLLTTATLVALMAGLFYSWTCSVIPGLARLPDDKYLAAMQSINRAIQNPLFFLGFMGAALLLPICVWMHYHGKFTGSAAMMIAAVAVYWIGVLGVTVLGNVPLNNMLDGADLAALSTAKLADLRSAFERPWIRLHQLRTVASVIALVLVLLACIRSGNADHVAI
jgi:uncharacterized membrane protein